MAFLASRFRVFSEMVTPLSAHRAMPIIVLAPMFNNIFWTTTASPPASLMTIVGLFPIFINTFKGLTQIDPSQRAHAVLRGHGR